MIMKTNTLLVLASLTLLAGGCATGPDDDSYYRRMDTPFYRNSSKLEAPRPAASAEVAALPMPVTSRFAAEAQ
jgi:hypothetical protein